MKDEILSIFASYPTAKEIYEDSNGNFWINKITAEKQSKDKKIKVHKRTEIEKLKSE